MGFIDFQNVHQVLRSTADARPEETAYRWFTAPGVMESINWSGFYDQVRSVGKSLIALGVEKNDKVSVLSYSCYPWILCDIGIMSIGAVTVGIYQSNLPKDCQYIIDQSDSVVIFCQDDTQLAKIMEIRDRIPAIRKVVLFSGNGQTDDWIIGWDDFLQLGSEIADAALDRRIESVTPEDPAGIVYTSGTTGVPKGAVLTHDNIAFTAQSVEASVDYREGDECFLFLPMAHVFARICVYATLLIGSALTFARSLDTIVEDIGAARPHWFPSVPRIYEKVYSKVLGGAEAKGGAALKIFRWACEVGRQVSDCKLSRKPIPFFLNVKYGLATKLVFSKVQKALGGRIRWCISGAAPLNPEIAKFFHAAGILILEGIGMTENTSFTNINRVDNYRFGWVGPPGPGIEQKVDEDGEVMYRGRNVMKEYYKMPRETAETITEDGWLRTGDLGEIDEENFLRITGRKKDLIITSGGKNIPPAAIEGLLATSKYINQVCVVGDRKKFLTALITIDPDNVGEWAQSEGIASATPSDLVSHPKVKALIEKEVAEKNKLLATFETIKTITIVPEFTIENGLMTPTMKLKKSLIVKNYSDTINSMYPVD
jgi:long-chain acyl-CoA synthetase